MIAVAEVGYPATDDAHSNSWSAKKTLPVGLEQGKHSFAQYSGFQLVAPPDHRPERYQSQPKQRKNTVAGQFAVGTQP